MDSILNTLQVKTEQFLTWRKRRKYIRKELQKRKNPILDWIEAFLWAACVVLLINQYLLQAYQIPSSSMEDTLLVSDRIFVNKFIYGPELLPGMFKLPSPVEPHRGEIIIFENPTYISQGPLFDIAQRIIYMLTLSLVDIDRNPDGTPKAHFLIKRAVGMGGDRLRIEDGDMFFMPQGTDIWLPESEFQEVSGVEYPVKRLVQESAYPVIREAGRLTALSDMEIELSAQAENALSRFQTIRYPDHFAFNRARTAELFAANPHKRRFSSYWRKYERGWYIPEGNIFAMGDNRDNSRDARWFGAIESDAVLGRAMFRYWPLHRVGGIE